MRAVIFITLLLAFSTLQRANADEPKGWYVAGQQQFHAVQTDSSINITWTGVTQYGEYTPDDTLWNSVLMYDGEMEDGKVVYYEYEPGGNVFTGKFIFRDEKCDSGTYMRKDGREQPFSKAGLQKDY